MYKFTLVIGLKNGQMITGVYQTSKSGSVDVAKELIPEKYIGNSYINAMMSEDGKEQIFFRAEDISMMKISVYQEREQKESVILCESDST